MEHDVTTARLFSIEEANSLVPELQQRVEELMDLGLEIQDCVDHLGTEAEPSSQTRQEIASRLRREEAAPPWEELDEHGGEATIVDVTLQPDDSQDVIQLKQNIVARIEAYQSGWSEIEKLGVIVKSTQSVQLDFYSRLDDRLVRLRWRYGEPGISFFHELDDIDDRPKALAPFRKRMLN